MFKGFPAIKHFEEQSLEMARKYGYVTTVCGRKRRLPDMQLPTYSLIPSEQYKLNFNTNEISVQDQQYYTKQLSMCQTKRQKDEVIANAKKYGIIIQDNSSKIAQATRQCVNSRIQGSAADLTKIAMIELHNSEELRNLGFRMLIPVHDEIIAECPKKNIKQCSELLATTMCNAAEKILNMPIKCDVAITEVWYGEEIELD